MTRSELIELVAARTKISLRQSEELVVTLFDTITDALKNDARVEIRGFGNFIVKRYKSYLGRNPKTGAFVHVNSKKAPFFRTSTLFKKRISS